MAGQVAAAGAVIALMVALAYAVGNLVFYLTTQDVIGEVIAVEPVKDRDGRPIPDSYLVEAEFPDRNGQFRRFDEEIHAFEVPEEGDEIPIRYRPRPPVQARVDQPWWIWRDATIVGGVALGLGVVAEELLRNRRRLSLAERPRVNS